MCIMHQTGKLQLAGNQAVKAISRDIIFIVEPIQQNRKKIDYTSDSYYFDDSLEYSVTYYYKIYLGSRNSQDPNSISHLKNKG